MTNKKWNFFFLLLFNCLLTFGQSHKSISGKIIDCETNEPLAFAAISLKNHLLGTISNENGEFDFTFPESTLNDTLIVSFLGYENYMKKLDQLAEGTSFIIKMNAKTVMLNEVNVSPLSPSDYIRRAIEFAEKNYASTPFQIIGYYNEDLIENNGYIHKTEAVFKSYCPKYTDTIKNQHQLLLYKKHDDVKKLEFMHKKFEKKRKKQEQKQAKRQQRQTKNPEQQNEKTKKQDQENDENTLTINLNNANEIEGLAFGGPETVLYFDVVKNNNASYLDTLMLDKFEYRFGTIDLFEGRKIQSIKFKSKKKIDGMHQHGTIYIDIENFAVVSIEHKGDFVIPLLARPILFAMGISIKKPKFYEKIMYQRFKGKYFPKNIHWNASGKITKRYIFRKNEHADMKLGQIFVVNRIELKDITEIPKEKQFNSSKKMKTQVHNDENLRWKDINKLKF